MSTSSRRRRRRDRRGARRRCAGAAQHHSGCVASTPASSEKLVAKQVFVKVGRRQGDLVEIASGLSAGQTVVTSGQNKLSNNAPVTINNDVNPAAMAPRGRRRQAVNFSEIFIRRPVLTIVVAILILLLGLQGFFNMTVREYPEVEESVITVTTTYPGASADLMQGFITTPIAKAVLTAENVDYVTSKSSLGSSTVTVHMVLGADPDKALVDVLSKVQQVRGQLPTDADDPVVQKGTGQNFALMYLAVRSTTMNPEQVTEYLTQVIQPRFATVEGVGEVQILGGRDFAMRVWLDPVRLAARGVTAGDVLAAIRASNFLSAPGKTENSFVAYAIQTATTLQTPEAFANLAVRANGDEIVRLGDVATVEYGAEERRRARHLQRPGGDLPRRASPHPTPTRSTPPRRSRPSCRKSSASCRRAWTSSSSTTRRATSAPRSTRCSRRSPRRSSSSS